MKTEPFNIYVRYCDDAPGMDAFFKPVDLDDDYISSPDEMVEYIADSMCSEGFSNATGIDQEDLEDWVDWREFKVQWRVRQSQYSVPYSLVLFHTPKLCEPLKHKNIKSVFYLHILRIEVVS